MHAGLARAGKGLQDATLEASLRKVFAASGQARGGADGAVAGYGLVVLLSATGRSSEAAAMLAELGRRYPRSPEYALAAAELRGGPAAGGAALPPVVALPSPSMLLGSAALACPAPCPVPAVARPARPPAAAPAASVASVTRTRPGTPSAAAPRRQAVAAAETAGAPQSVSPSTEPPAGRVAPAPVRAPAPVTGQRRPAKDLAEVPNNRPSRTAASATAEGSRSAGTGAAVVLRTATPNPAPEEPPDRADPAEPASVAAPAETPVTEPAPAQSAAGSETSRAAKSRTVRYTSPPAKPMAAATPRTAEAADRSASAPARAPSTVTGKKIRVTAQPANRAQLATDRVFVSAQPRAEASAAAAGAATARAATAPASAGRGNVRSSSSSSSSSAVRVSSLPDPAAFVVQVGAYLNADNALDMELRLRQAGFSAIARSYRNTDGSIVHRVGVGGNVTRARGEQVLAQLKQAGFEPYMSRRDVVSYLPPAPRRR